MVNYMILREPNLNALEAKTQRYVAAGWRPVGSFQYIPGVGWCQGILKEPVEQIREPRSP